MLGLDQREFNLRMLDGIEHQVDGVIDDKGVFTGRIKHFGKWIDEEIVIHPPKDLVLSLSLDGKVGPMSIYVATMEQMASKSSLTKDEFTRYAEISERYSGFMLFRDGLRVLPFGRTDNDFFEIEERRSYNAGREFWNKRRMFGGVAISRARNPNLKDKAGREGLLDNRATKAFKAIIINVLMQSARLYFGSDSTYRKPKVEEAKETTRQAKLTTERGKLAEKQAKAFTSSLRKNSKPLRTFAQSIRRYVQSVPVSDDIDIASSQQRLEDARFALKSFELPLAPENLGPLRSQYDDYSSDFDEAEAALNELRDKISDLIERANPNRKRELIEAQAFRLRDHIARRVADWNDQITQIQRGEYERLRELVKQRSDLFPVEAGSYLNGALDEKSILN